MHFHRRAGPQPHALRLDATGRQHGLSIPPPLIRAELIEALKRDAKAEFIAGHDDEKVIGILAKTARKMSERGLEAAAKLALDGRLAGLLGEALGANRATASSSPAP